MLEDSEEFDDICSDEASSEEGVIPPVQLPSIADAANNSNSDFFIDF